MVPTGKGRLLLTVLLGLEVNAGFLALLGSDRCRSCGQRVVTATGLGEGNDVADRVGATDQLQHAVPTESDTAHGGRTEAEGLQQEAELLLSLFLGNTHDLEDTFLHVTLVDTD